MRRALLWDLDGTLLDSNLSIRETMNAVLAGAGFPAYAQAELEALIGTPLRDILARKCPDPAKVEAMAHRYRAVYGESGWVTVRFHPGTLELAQRLRSRGVAQAVVTSKGQREAETLMADLGTADLWDAIVGDDDVRPLKPDPAPVRAALDILGAAPEDAVLVGDTRFDALAALGAGVHFVGARWGNGRPGELEGAGARELARDARGLARLLRGRWGL